jgi:large subunit ribosomal protein L6
VSPLEDTRFARAMYGTARSIIAGMVKGVTTATRRTSRSRASASRPNLKGKQLDLALGFSHPIFMDIPEGIKLTVTEGTRLKVEGCDKQLVGPVTARSALLSARALQGQGCPHRRHAERVRRKEGKTVA